MLKLIFTGISLFSLFGCGRAIVCYNCLEIYQENNHEAKQQIRQLAAHMSKEICRDHIESSRTINSVSQYDKYAHSCIHLDVTQRPADGHQRYNLRYSVRAHSPGGKCHDMERTIRQAIIDLQGIADITTRCEECRSDRCNAYSHNRHGGRGYSDSGYSGYPDSGYSGHSDSGYSGYSDSGYSGHSDFYYPYSSANSVQVISFFASFILALASYLLHC